MVMIILHQSSFLHDSCTTLQVILPPVFVYFIALLIMLKQISDRCGASIYTYGYIICSVRESVWFLLSACCWNIMTQFSKHSWTFETVYSISTLLFSILARFKTLPSIDKSSFPHIWIFPRYLLSFSVSIKCLDASSAYPIIAFIGVLMSWDILNRNVDFALFAHSAFNLASLNSSSCFNSRIFSSVTSRFAISTDVTFPFLS